MSFITGSKKYETMSTEEKVNVLVEEATPKYFVLDDTTITKDDFKNYDYDLNHCRVLLAKSDNIETINKVISELRKQGVNDAKILNYVTLMINSYHNKKFCRRDIAIKFFVPNTKLEKENESKTTKTESSEVNHKKETKIKNTDGITKKPESETKETASDKKEKAVGGPAKAEDESKVIEFPVENTSKEEPKETTKTVGKVVFHDEDDTLDGGESSKEEAKSEKPKEEKKTIKPQKTENASAAKTLDSSLGFDARKFIKKPNNASGISSNNDTLFIPYVSAGLPIMDADDKAKLDYVLNRINFVLPHSLNTNELNALISFLNSEQLSNLCKSNPIIADNGIPLISEIGFGRSESHNKNDYKLFIPLTNGSRLYMVFNTMVRKNSITGVVGSNCRVWVGK